MLITTCLMCSFYRYLYHFHFKQGFGRRCQAMEYEDQWCLGLFLLELKRHRDKLLDNSTLTQAHQQRTITNFFSPITPTHATNQSKATQNAYQRGHNKGCFPCFKDLSILDQPMLEIFRRQKLQYTYTDNKIL